MGKTILPFEVGEYFVLNREGYYRVDKIGRISITGRGVKIYPSHKYYYPISLEEFDFTRLGNDYDPFADYVVGSKDEVYAFQKLISQRLDIEEDDED